MLKSPERSDKCRPSPTPRLPYPPRARKILFTNTPAHFNSPVKTSVKKNLPLSVSLTHSPEHQNLLGVIPRPPASPLPAWQDRKPPWSILGRKHAYCVGVSMLIALHTKVIMDLQDFTYCVYATTSVIRRGITETYESLWILSSVVHCGSCSATTELSTGAWTCSWTTVMFRTGCWMLCVTSCFCP